MQPLDYVPPHYVSAEPAQYALEVNQGFFEERGVMVGDTVELPVQGEEGGVVPPEIPEEAAPNGPSAKRSEPHGRQLRKGIAAVEWRLALDTSSKKVQLP
jgi:hypothetical protein